jgi:outer membrane cobalamin receptor
VVIIGLPATTLALETDASGAFRADRLPAGRYEVLVTRVGFSADPMIVDLASDADREVAIQLRLSAVTESIVVSATQVDLPLSRVSGAATVISREDIESRQIDSVAGALRLVPGLSVTQTGGRGGIVSLFQRGGESDFTLVLVDGVKVNAFGGGFDFSEIAGPDSARIVFGRGPQSAACGGAASAGAAHIATRLHGRPAAEAVVEAGGLGTTRLSAAANGTVGRWSLAGSAQRVHSKGFTGEAPASNETVSNDDAEYLSAGGSMAWRADGGAEVRASVRTTWSDRGFPGPFGSNPIGAFPGVDRVSRGESRSVQTGARLAAPFSGVGQGGRALVQFGYLDTASDYASPYGKSESGSRRWTLRAQADLAPTSTSGLSAGVEVQRERATSTYITGTGFNEIPVERLVSGLFVEGRWQPSARLAATGGVRADWIRRERLEANADPYSPRPAFDVETVVAVNPRVSVGYTVRDAGGRGGRRWPPLTATRVRASAGTGIRPPDAFEIAFTDNPALKPERTRSVEGGLEQGLAGDAVRIDVTAFWNDYDDLIVAVGRGFTDASRYRTDNIANARARGVELGVAARAAFGMEVRAAYTWLASEVRAVDGGSGLAPSPFSVGDWLIRRPRHQGFVDVVLRRARFTANAQVGMRGRVLDIEPNWGAWGGLFNNPGYAVASAGVAVRVARSLHLVARVSNLFNRSYEEAFGFPSPGRVGTVVNRFAAGL